MRFVDKIISNVRTILKTSYIGWRKHGAFISHLPLTYHTST